MIKNYFILILIIILILFLINDYYKSNKKNNMQIILDETKMKNTIQNFTFIDDFFGFIYDTLMLFGL